MRSAPTAVVRRTSREGIREMEGNVPQSALAAVGLEEEVIDAVPVLAELPPRSSWLYSGSMSKKVTRPSGI